MHICIQYSAVPFTNLYFEGRKSPPPHTLSPDTREDSLFDRFLGKVEIMNNIKMVLKEENGSIKVEIFCGKNGKFLEYKPFS